MILNLVEIGELDDEVSQAAYNAILESGYNFGEKKEIFLTFDYSGEDYHAMFAPIPDLLLALAHRYIHS